VKEASNREKEDQLILERLGNQLKYNMKKLEEEQIMLGKVLQTVREANNHLHQNRFVVERMARLVDKPIFQFSSVGSPYDFFLSSQLNLPPSHHS
jgi:hypothetical protein